MVWPPERAIPPCTRTAHPTWPGGRPGSGAGRRSPRCPLAAWPDVASTAIYGRDDLAIAGGWVERTARERLHGKAYELPGGHSPFLARPHDLAQILHTI